jgi:glutamate dehydrogenase/leucine dehydrogenase
MATSAEADGAATSETTSDDESALATARRQLDRAASNLDVDQNVLERLKHPRAVHEVTVPLERVHEELESEMLDAWNAVRAAYEDGASTWRAAAYAVALRRVVAAHEARGVWP